MITIIATAIGAIAAISTYNTSVAKAPNETGERIHGIRQAVSVVLAIGEAIWSILDALMFLTRSRGSSGGSSAAQPAGRKFGSTLASEAT